MATIVWLVLVVLLVVCVIHAGTWWWRRDRRGARDPMRKIVGEDRDDHDSRGLNLWRIRHAKVAQTGWLGVGGVIA